MGANVQVSTLRKGDGGYSLCAVSGALTGVAAGTATAGHLWVARWAPTIGVGNYAPQFALLQRLRARWFTILGFTAAQQIGIELFQLRSFTANYSGGTAQTLTTPNQKSRTNMPASAFADIRIGTTGALTAGTQTLDAQPIRRTAFAELAAAATVPKGQMELFLSREDLERYPIVLAANEGLMIRNTVLMGAGGTAELDVEMDWLEVQRY